MLKLKISLLSLFLTALLASSSVSPLLPYIAANVGGAGFAKIFLTLPSLIVVPFLFFSGFLERFFSKKNLVMGGLYLYIISAIVCFVSLNPTLMLTGRAMAGIAAGLVTPYSALLISDYFSGPQRDKLIGQSGIIVYSSGIILLLAIGFIASIYWRLGLLIPLIALIPLILIKKNIPNVVSNKSNVRIPLKFQFALKKEVYQSALFYFLAIIIVFTYFVITPFLIEEKGIGASKEVAIAQSFFMLAGVISNFFMSIIKNYSRMLLHSIQALFVAQGFIILGLYSSSASMVYLASFLIGIGYGSFGNSLVSVVSHNSHRITRLNALAILMTAMYVGQFISPIFTTYIMNLFSLSYSGWFLLNGLIIMVVCFVVFYFFIKDNKRKLFKLRK